MLILGSPKVRNNAEKEIEPYRASLQPGFGNEGVRDFTRGCSQQGHYPLGLIVSALEDEPGSKLIIRTDDSEKEIILI